MFVVLSGAFERAYVKTECYSKFIDDGENSSQGEDLLLLSGLKFEYLFIDPNCNLTQKFRVAIRLK